MKPKLETGKIYHVANHSVNRDKIFYSGEDYVRMVRGMIFYSQKGNFPKFSQFLKSKDVRENNFKKAVDERAEKSIVDIVAYCLTPTHFRFILKQNEDGAISRFVRDFSNSYSRYFNNRHKRKGPLWQGRFKRAEIEMDELECVTGYLHLKPVFDGLVEHPGQWKASSYLEFVDPASIENPICKYEDILDIDPESYKNLLQSGKINRDNLEVDSSKLLN